MKKHKQEEANVDSRNSLHVISLMLIGGKNKKRGSDYNYHNNIS